MKKLGLWVLLLVSAITLLAGRRANAEAGWNHLRTVTIDHTQVSGTGDLRDFPMLIHITMGEGEVWLKDIAHGGDVAQADGGDIFFTLADYTRLDHEIETYDPISGILIAWVRIPTLSATSDTRIYMFYGNADAGEQSNPPTVWDTNYLMAQHLVETSGTHYDSTANRNNCAPLNGVNQDAVGKIDGADDFDGGDDAVNCGTGEKDWRNQDQGQQRAVIKDGKIYVVGGGDDSVTTFDAHGYIFDLVTGQLLQQSPSLGQYESTASETAPVVDGNMLYVTPTKSNIRAWDTISNTIIWTTTNLSIWSNRLEFDGSYLYATTIDYQVVRVDTSDGTVVDSFALDPDTGGENAVPPYLDQANDTLFALGASRLYKLSASSLTEQWHRDIGTGCLDTGPGHSRMAPIVVNDDHTGSEPWVILGCWGTDVFYAYDYDGNLEWSKPIPEGVSAVASYNPNNGYLYIASQGDRIYALDVETGEEQFSITGDDVPDGSGFINPCTISGNYLIFNTTSGSPSYLYIFDATTGNYLTQYTLGSNLFLSDFPVAASQGYLVTGGSLINYGPSSLDGGLFAVKAGTGQVVDYYPLYGPDKFGYVENALSSVQPNTLNPAGQITLEAWANLDAIIPEAMSDHLLCRANTYCLKFAQYDDGANGVPRFQLWDPTGIRYNLDLSTRLNTGQWYYLAGTWDGTTMNFYVNGLLRNTRLFTGVIASTDASTFIGSYSGASRQAPLGLIDEVRLSDTARSARWIATTYHNQNDPSSFYAIGPEQLPGLSIAKSPPTQTVPYGSAATFTITLSNTGDVDFSQVQVVDPLASGCNRTLSALAAGTVTNYTCTMPNVQLDAANLVTATAEASAAMVLTATSSAFVDILPTLELHKSAKPSTLYEPGGPITFTLALTNTSPELFTLTSLSDSMYGDLDGQGFCPVPQTLGLGDTYRCSFTATVSGPAGHVETDEVVAAGHDDDLNPVQVSDRATVTITTAPAILLAPKALTVAEPYGSAHFTFTLTTQPAAPVSIGLSPSNAECSVAPSPVILDSNNWASGASATVSAEDDHIFDGSQTCIVQSAQAVSDDPNYNFDPDDVTVTVLDDDQKGIVITPTILTIAEPDGSNTFLVKLYSQPTASVTIGLSPSNNECSVSAPSITLDSSNWASGVSATVTAVNDGVSDGDQTCVVDTAPSSSSDPNYLGIDPDDVVVTVLDYERGIQVIPTTLTVAEPDGFDTFLVVLQSQPGAPVTVALRASNDECSVAPSSVILDASNWASGVSATVAAVDDTDSDGDQICIVYTAPSSSSDPNYRSIDPDDVTVTVQDNDFGTYLPLTVRGWPPVPALLPISNPGGIGAYTVSWTPIPRAETYSLEEAKDPSFGDAKQVYAGPSTSHQVTGRGAARYYYRVQAHATWGNTAWSDPRQVDVLWEAEPNDDGYNQANGPLVCGQTYFGAFPNLADVNDYYYFDLSSPCRADLWLTNIPVGHNYDLVLRSDSLDLLGYSGELGNANEHVQISTLPIGRYKIQVHHRGGDGSLQPYHLQLTCSCGQP